MRYRTKDARSALALVMTAAVCGAAFASLFDRSAAAQEQTTPRPARLQADRTYRPVQTHWSQNLEPVDGLRHKERIWIHSNSEALGDGRKGILIERRVPLHGGEMEEVFGELALEHMTYDLVTMGSDGLARLVTSFETDLQPVRVADPYAKDGLELAVADAALAYLDTGDVTVLWPVSATPTPDPVCLQTIFDQICPFDPIKVLLRFRDGAYRVAEDRMRRPPWDADRIAQHAAAIRASAVWDMPGRHVPFQLAYDIATLVYSGNASQVPGLLDAAWPAGHPGREALLHDLYNCRIGRSRYWPGIAALNGLPEERPDATGCPAMVESNNPFAWFQGAYTIGPLTFKLFARQYFGSERYVLVALRDGNPVMDERGKPYAWTGRYVDVGMETGGPGDDRVFAVVTTEDGGSLEAWGSDRFDVTNGTLDYTDGAFSSGQPSLLEDLDGKPGLEAIVTDSVFFDAPYGRQLVEVRLSKRDGLHTFDADLMRKPIPFAITAEGWAEQLHKKLGPAPQPYGQRDFLLRIMAELIFSGHAEAALRLADIGWPSELPGKVKAINEFYRCQLRLSPYWPHIAAMNDLPVDQPEGDC